MTSPASTGPRGTLFLVVGPSGAGKDTLLDRARAALAGEPDYLFPRRVITRAADAGGEAHEAVSQDDFDAIEAAGGFALFWRAHGLVYGIRADAAAALVAGRHVVANVSRQVIDEARRRYAPAIVIEITARREILAARLAARGRESAQDIAARLARSRAMPLSGQVERVDNSGDPESGAVALLAVLRR